MKKFKKYIFLSDVHFKSVNSEHDKGVFNIVKKVANDLRPDGLMLLGDMIDADGVSKFTYKEWKDGAYETIEDIYNFRKNYFNPLVKSCNNKKLDIRWCLGNHEDRIRLFLNKIKERECRSFYNDWKKKFDLKKIFPEVNIKEYNACHRLGHLYLTHGEFHNLAHTRKHATVYGKNILYGHLHTWDVTTVATKATGKVHSAYSMPGACKFSPEYINHKASAWVKGFMVGYVWPNGLYQLVPLIIMNGRVIFNNKIYYE